MGEGLGLGVGLGLGNHIAISTRGVIIWQGGRKWAQHRHVIRGGRGPIFSD